MPTCSATASIVRSIVKQAAGRDTPRYAPSGHLLVATETASTR
jgi:hypothetical protein